MQPFSRERLAYLLQAYTSRTATPAEEQELFAMMQERDAREPVEAHIRQLIQEDDPAALTPAADWEAMYRQIEEKVGPAAPVMIKERRRIWPHIAAACILLALAGAAIWYMAYTARPAKEIAEGKPKATPANDIAPGSNGAILTLANGRQIVLDSAGNGVLAMQGSARLQHRPGRLTYYNEQATASGKAVYNTMTTTRGKQYQLTLADGSKVWLNTASSITFPTSFTGRQRKVSITGEAYFEIAQDAARPFVVAVNGMEIQVLGTAFNINAYDDEESARTTLFEGKVKLVRHNASALLSPGQQARVNKTGDIKVIRNADLQEAAAWKEGLFIMNKADIGSIMRQIARWYDVEVVYPEGVPPGRISGDMPRNMHLSKVLQVLELSGVHFKIEGRRVEVRP